MSKRWTKEEENTLLHTYCLYGSREYLNHLDLGRTRKACAEHLRVLLKKQAKEAVVEEEKKEKKSLFSWFKSLFCK